MAKSTRSRASERATRARPTPSTVFERRNYLLLLAGVLVIVIGFAMMRIENEVNGFISLYVAPLLILGGYLEIIYAILWQPKRPEVAATRGD